MFQIEQSTVPVTKFVNDFCPLSSIAKTRAAMVSEITKFARLDLRRQQAGLPIEVRDLAFMLQQYANVIHRHPKAFAAADRDNLIRAAEIYSHIDRFYREFDESKQQKLIKFGKEIVSISQKQSDQEGVKKVAGLVKELIAVATQAKSPAGTQLQD